MWAGCWDWKVTFLTAWFSLFVKKAKLALGFIIPKKFPKIGLDCFQDKRSAGQISRWKIYVHLMKTSLFSLGW